MNLKDIFCQSGAIDGLQRAYNSDRMPHAYIFAGAEGVGKFTSAAAWAKMLLCHDKKKVPDTFNCSCDECSSCKLFEGGSHPDFKHVYKELVKFTQGGKNKTTPLDMPKSVIDEFLIDKIATRPIESDMTVYIVSEAEKLNVSSQNALLKVLEEPPGHCLIIMLCTRSDKLLPTTLSRCQLVRFGPIDEEIIVSKLTESGVLQAEAIYWARFAGHSIGTAIAWSQLKPKEASCYKTKTELVSRLASYELADALDMAVWILKQTKDISAAMAANHPDLSKTDLSRRTQKGILKMMMAVYSDAMRLTLGDSQTIVNADQGPQIAKIASSKDTEQLSRIVTKIAENMQWIDASVNEKLIFEELLLSCGGCGIV